jgi:hypothetical protein
MAEIYGLYSAKDGEIRYVGQTGVSHEVRFKQHLREAPSMRVWNWFHAQWRQGFPVKCALLQVCDYDHRHRVETEWISKFQNILNERKVGFRGGKPPIITEIVKYRRGWRFNVHGFRGIHWRRQNDRYAVWTCTGEWLLGDEDEITGGNIWFSDLAEAIEARDAHRKYLRYKNWLRDSVEEEDSPWQLLPKETSFIILAADG